MIAAVVVFIYVFLLTFLFGLIFFQTAAKLHGVRKIPEYIRLDIIIFSGLISLTAVLAILSLFMPIDHIAHFIIVSIAVIGSWVHYGHIERYCSALVGSVRGMSFPLKVNLGVLVLIIVLSAVSEPYLYDTGLYHAQAIQWLEKYRVIPGLGNLHDRLAMNSHFFIVSAFFSLSFLRLGPFHLLGAFMMLVFCSSCLCFLHRKRSSGEERLTYALLLFFAFFFYYKWISTTSPDLIVALFIWYIFLVYLDGEQDQEDGAIWNNWRFLFIFSASFSLLAIKLSSFPIILAPCLLLVPHIRSLRPKGSLFFYGAWMGVLLVPWLARNIVLSGYIIYPLNGIDFFDVDWKIPEYMAVEAKNGIRSFAVIPSDVDNETRQTHSAFRQWFPVWIKAKPRDILEKVILLAVFLSPMLKLRLFLRNRGRKSLYPWGISYVGVLFWFVTAPDFRFVHGFLVASFLLVLLDYETIPAFMEKNNSGIRKATALSLALYAGFLLFMSTTSVSGGALLEKARMVITTSLEKHWLVPAPYPEPEVREVNVGSVAVRIPLTSDQCWNVAIPCSPMQQFGNDLRLRGEGVEDGFYRAGNDTIE